MVKARLDDPLTADQLRALLDYDPATGHFTWKWRDGLRGSSNARNAGKAAGGPDAVGYIRIDVNSKHYLAHRLAWLYVHGCWPKEQIDHINEIPSDNRIANLRECSHGHNNVRSHPMKNNRSGILGVYPSPTKGKWYVTVRRSGKQIWLGTFATLEEAIAVREEEVRRSYGEFSRLD